MASRDGRAVVWTHLWDPARTGWGTELLRLGDGHAVSTAVLFDEGGEPYELRYEIAWRPDWKVTRLDATTSTVRERRTLALRADGSGAWTNGEGRALPALDGCTDVDIWPTPFTNTFPIRRLGRAADARIEIRVAWIAAPALSVEPVAQAYTRLADRRVRFESVGDSFRADLEIDADGLVADYPGLFTRLV